MQNVFGFYSVVFMFAVKTMCIQYSISYGLCISTNSHSLRDDTIRLEIFRKCLQFPQNPVYPILSVCACVCSLPHRNVTENKYNVQMIQYYAQQTVIINTCKIAVNNKLRRLENGKRNGH